MSTRERSAVISDFQRSDTDSPTVLLRSLRAGGVGLHHPDFDRRSKGDFAGSAAA